MWKLIKRWFNNKPQQNIEIQEEKFDFPDIVDVDALPKIKTARSLQEINQAVKDGYRVVIQELVPHQAIQSFVVIARNIQTGFYEEVYDRRFISSSGKYDDINLVEFYPYKFPNPFAAYLIPQDLKPNVMVWLEDLIEDIPGNKRPQGVTKRVESAPALWTGEKMEIHMNYINRHRSVILG